MTMMFAGGVTYFAGMFLCMVIFNVPLNNALASLDASSPEANAVWRRYLKDGTAWNHLRTAACLVACGLFFYAIVIL